MCIALDWFKQKELSTYCIHGSRSPVVCSIVKSLNGLKQAPCIGDHKVVAEVRVIAAQGPKILMGERLKPYALRGQPHACELCRKRISDKLGFEPGTVVHADLIPSLVGLRIFQAMPASVRCQAVFAALAGKGMQHYQLIFLIM